ncbi:prefoldin subunit alpha [Candidatus Bathyarchaeota archaeon]|nr:prefoldin subunit alpha [Candidatus Bathyarchaeota archaeon]
MTNEEETLRRMIIELRLLEGTAEELQARLNIIDSAIADSQIAGLTLDGLKNKEKDTQLLIPIGAGSYIKAGIVEPDKVIIGIGAGISVEKTIDEAKTSVANQLAELEKVRQSLQQQFVQVAQKINETRSKINELSRKISEGTRRV